MILWQYKQLKHSGTSEHYLIEAVLRTAMDQAGTPIVSLQGAPFIGLPLDEARRLARKILSIPTPVGFKELPDA